MTNERIPSGNPFGAEFLGLGPVDFTKNSVEAMLKVQTEFMGNLEGMSRAWLAHTQTTANLVTDLIRQLASARSAPETAAAYQKFFSRRMEMLVEDSRNFFAQSEKFMDAAARVLSNGLPLAAGRPGPEKADRRNDAVENLAERRRERDTLRAAARPEENS